MFHKFILKDYQQDASAICQNQLRRNTFFFFR